MWVAAKELSLAQEMRNTNHRPKVALPIWDSSRVYAVKIRLLSVHGFWTDLSGSRTIQDLAMIY